MDGDDPALMDMEYEEDEEAMEEKERILCPSVSSSSRAPCMISRVTWMELPSVVVVRRLAYALGMPRLLLSTFPLVLVVCR